MNDPFLSNSFLLPPSPPFPPFSPESKAAPDKENPLLVELTKYLEATGNHDPLTKVRGRTLTSFQMYQY
jgi:hypothetical protein